MEQNRESFAIWGTNDFSKVIYENNRNFADFLCFLDSRPATLEFCGKPIYRFEDFISRQTPITKIFMTLNMYSPEVHAILAQLRNYGLRIGKDILFAQFNFVPNLWSYPIMRTFLSANEVFNMLYEAKMRFHKRIVFLSGKCQMRKISDFLLHNPAFASHHIMLILDEWEEIKPPYDLDNPFWKMCDVFITHQILEDENTGVTNKQLKAALSPHAIFIKVPSILFDVYFPQEKSIKKSNDNISAEQFHNTSKFLIADKYVDKLIMNRKLSRYAHKRQ